MINASYINGCMKKMRGDFPGQTFPKLGINISMTWMILLISLYSILIPCHRTYGIPCNSVMIGLELEGYYKILPQKCFSSHIHSFNKYFLSTWCVSGQDLGNIVSDKQKEQHIQSLFRIPIFGATRSNSCQPS